jgi:hypothetical protein
MIEARGYTYIYDADGRMAPGLAAPEARNELAQAGRPG